MESRENLIPFGRLIIELFDEDGNLKDYREVANLIVDAGKAFIAQSILKTTNSPAAMTHMGIGTSSTAAAGAQTALVSEIGTRQAVTPSNVTVTVTNDSAQYVATFAAGNGTGAITEAGLFNASSAGTMLARTVFAVVNKAAGDSMSITWKVTAG